VVCLGPYLVSVYHSSAGWCPHPRPLFSLRPSSACSLSSARSAPEPAVLAARLGSRAIEIGVLTGALAGVLIESRRLTRQPPCQSCRSMRRPCHRPRAEVDVPLLGRDGLGGLTAGESLDGLEGLDADRPRRRKNDAEEIFAALAAAESLRRPRRLRSLRRVCRCRWLLAAQPAIADRGALAVSDRLTPS
jgi:hypothetical protein